MYVCSDGRVACACACACAYACVFPEWVFELGKTEG